MRFNSLPFSPELIHARWEFGKVATEDIPKLAQDALERGYDGENIRKVAGLVAPTYFDLQPLKNGFLRELGITQQLSNRDAGLLLSRLIADGIAKGQIAPYEGSSFIWREIANELWHPERPQQLLPFIGEACEYEDCEFYAENPEEVRREIERSIVELAREFSIGAGK
jgi:hypothetical protein